MTISVTKAATFGQNQAKIKQPKTEAGKRIVPFPVQLLPIFKEEKRNSFIYVCPAADGSMMTNTAWTTSWNSYMHYLNNQAGGRDASRSHPKVVAMDRFTAHQLRHTYATMLYDAGTPISPHRKRRRRSLLCSSILPTRSLKRYKSSQLHF